MANGVRDPLAGINSFAPEFWRLVAESAPLAPIAKLLKPQSATAPQDAPDPYPPFTDPFAPEPGEPEELSPKDLKREQLWRDYGELPVYRGDPPRAEHLPPATGQDIEVRPPTLKPQDVPMILDRIAKLRERLSRGQEYQRKGLSDPRLDSELADMRKQLDAWEKALADRAEGGT